MLGLKEGKGTVGTLPVGNAGYMHIGQPSHYFAKEVPGVCPGGYQCWYGGWYPSIQITGKGLWVFGVTVQAQSGGILHFRAYPDYFCSQHCIQELPILYTAEVMYVPYWGSGYTPESVPVTYIPPGRYVVTSPSFYMHTNMRLWYFYDDGTGPKKMSAKVTSDSPQYGGENSTLLLQVKDNETGEFLKVDSISGVITLPDCTQKTVVTEDWCWNETEERYEYVWNFTNDNNVVSNPKEGEYTCEVTVKKKFYEDSTASCSFNVCYHARITLLLDEGRSIYAVGEPVKMTVYAEEANNTPVEGTVESALVFEGSLIPLSWTSPNPGTYVTTYTPEKEGDYTIMVRIRKEGVCYLEEASSTFSVRVCEPLFVAFEPAGAVINEPVELIVTVTDEDGSPVPGCTIDTSLHLSDDSVTPVSWVDEGDGTYRAVYTPSMIGLHTICGSVFAFGENNCFYNSLDGMFTVSEKKLPDLVIRNEDITVNPQPALGDTVTISVTVWNVGNKKAENFWVLILINDEVLYREFIGVLAENQSVTITYQWTVLYSGGFIIQALADPPEGLL